MSRSKPDQRGGHPRRDKKLSGTLSCGCCEHIPPKTKDPSRTTREREASRDERNAGYCVRNVRHRY